MINFAPCTALAVSVPSLSTVSPAGLTITTSLCSDTSGAYVPKCTHNRAVSEISRCRQLMILQIFAVFANMSTMIWIRYRVSSVKYVAVMRTTSDFFRCEIGSRGMIASDIFPDHVKWRTVGRLQFAAAVHRQSMLLRDEQTHAHARSALCKQGSVGTQSCRTPTRRRELSTQTVRPSDKVHSLIMGRKTWPNTVPPRWIDNWCAPGQVCAWQTRRAPIRSR